jgi:hypothetical protein
LFVSGGFPSFDTCETPLCRVSPQPPVRLPSLTVLGTVAAEDHAMRVLAPRSDMTGADRTWAARYAVNDVLHYPRGSQDIGIEKQSYTKVIATQPKDNLLTVQKEDGKTVTYNPARLYGMTAAYRELEREFAIGDRLSFTAPSKELGVANRDLGTVHASTKTASSP